jgi:hypothetical protein
MLIGLNAFSGDAGAVRRQQAAAEHLLRLSSTEVVNLQFRSGPQTTLAGIETLPALSQDSREIAGPGSRSKAMTLEMFDVLAATASARGHDYFAYVNSDIIVLPAALDRIVDGRRETYAISRYDVASADDLKGGTQVTAGVDMFVFSPVWWRSHRRRFRSYVVGDACWDNVYTAVMMCHSNGAILNRDPLIVHERHPAVWNDATSSASYNGFMAALDARYFSLWCQYFARLEKARADGASAAVEQELRDSTFSWRPSVTAAVRQSIRSIRARWQFHRLRSSAMASLAR